MSDLRSLTQLMSLHLSSNNFSGEVPPEFGEFKELVNLGLAFNNLVGELPQSLGSWAKFNSIEVSANPPTLIWAALYISS